MKKVLAIALGLLLIPFAAFGMESMSIDEMAEITGQSGVAISLDDVKVFFYNERDEVWYQTAANFTAVNNDAYDYLGAIGLVYDTTAGRMMYLNAIMAPGTDSNAINGAAGTQLYSPGRPLMLPYYTGKSYGDWSNDGYNFGNADVTIENAFLGGAVITGFEATLASSDFGTDWDEWVYKIDDGTNSSYYDFGFDSRALTIYVDNNLEIFSEATTNRLNALVGKNGLSPGSLSADYATYNPLTMKANVNGITIGLPTVEIVNQTQEGDTLEILLSVAPNPLTRTAFNGSPTAETWSYGKLYFGPSASEATKGRITATVVLDGTIEIVPIQRYAVPGFYIYTP